MLPRNAFLSAKKVSKRKTFKKHLETFSELMFVQRRFGSLPLSLLTPSALSLNKLLFLDRSQGAQPLREVFWFRWGRH